MKRDEIRKMMPNLTKAIDKLGEDPFEGYAEDVAWLELHNVWSHVEGSAVRVERLTRQMEKVSTLLNGIYGVDSERRKRWESGMMRGDRI